jgi:diguanylate cyclase (GGDEF)-like protein
LHKLKYWRQRLATLQGWTGVERACVPIALTGLLYLQYFFWGLAAQTHDKGQTLINPAFLWPQALLAGVVVLAAALLLMAARALDRRQPEALWFQHLGANFYGLSLVWGGYCTGTLSMPAGVVLAGAPLLGFLLLERRVMLVAIAIAFSAILVLNVASAYGLLPYAPALRAPTDTDSALFWVASHLSFAAPHLLVNTGLCAVLLEQWRRREAEVLALSLTDALTDVHNRRSILDLLEAEVARARRQGAPLSVALLDLDFFKQINDRYGHPAGDRVLHDAAQVLRATVRQTDAVGRFGGEEFLLLLPDTDAVDAAVVLEHCRRELAALAIPAEGGGFISVTASFGIACCDSRLEPIGAALVHAADVALYQAKQAGRNRVIVANRADVAAAVDADTGQLAATQFRRFPVNQPWWKSRQGWRQKIAGILDWRTTDKVALFMGVLLLIQAGVLLAMLAGLRPAAALQSGTGIVRTIFWMQVALSFVTLLLFAVARKFSRWQVEAPWLEHLTLQYGGLAMVAMGFGAGILGISTGVVLTVGPLVGFLLFRRNAVLAAFATSLLGVVVLAYASALGLLPYAPLASVSPPAWQLSTPMWVLSNYLFFMPVLIGGLVLADQILGRWREREARIRDMSLTDALTGVHNRRSILGLLDTEVARANRAGPTLAVVILDLDYFKRINDTFGHYIGDRVLQETTRVLRATLRQYDAVGRFGGEEFLLLLPDTSLEGAMILAERCRARIAEAVVQTENGASVTFTASFGLACSSDEECRDSDGLIRVADRALYRAKHAGRNRVEAEAATAA